MDGNEAASATPRRRRSPAPRRAAASEEGGDVFVSYARSDQPVVARLARTLWAEGFDVWFDERIPAGSRWNDDLVRRLERARAVLVVWTARSLARPWVLREADFARRAGKLVPVVLEDVRAALPPRFRALQTARLIGWDGAAPHAESARLLDGLALLAPPRNIQNVRPGVDTAFLGAELALPSVAGVAEEFRYLHFSVVMNPARRLPWYVAYNLAPRNAEAERGERWRPDPMLPAAFQPQDAHFRGTGFYRGHIVSPANVSWGSRREAEIANHQTFFWTNTVPQHALTNQRWWLATEMWEREASGRLGRALGFAGPVLAADDPLHVTSETMIGRLRVRENFRLPRAFWKVVVFGRAPDRLCHAAFLVDQEALLADRARPRAAAELQVPLALVQARTGLVFDALEGSEELRV